MIFYTFDQGIELSSISISNDIDPAAERMPDDLRQQHKSFAIYTVRRPSDPTGSLSASITNVEAQRSQTALMRRASEFRIARDVAALSMKLEKANGAKAKQNSGGIDQSNAERSRGRKAG